MSSRTFLSVLLYSFLLVSCGNRHLIKDISYRKTVRDDFMARSRQYGVACNGLFEEANEIKDITKREATWFMLAYMPLNDLALCDFNTLSRNIDIALETRRETKWGTSVPFEVFLHFVLPQRVNTENLDSFRISVYNELTRRVEGLDAEKAAIEINHWCHEKVSYQPSDSRTSAPLSTILSSRGRCGEESTLAVSALRTIGLPARQVYTPRWAHTDDNHAWVEVWINGSWYYLGACEPEPVLDRGWFTEPARRAMLVHTKAFGKYNGNEPVNKNTELYSELNILSKYAVTKKLNVLVTDENGNPVPSADVSFLLYNYAEFYPIATLKSDDNGNALFITGKGSLIVWACSGDKYGFTEAAPDADKVTVKVSRQHSDGTFTFDLKAPVAPEPKPGIDESLSRQNTARLKCEDSIRQAYINGWMTDINVEELLKNKGVDKASAENALKASMGNYRAVYDFILNSGDKGDVALKILENISEKDLRDTPARVLNDNMINAPLKEPGLPDSIYFTYVLSPRIDNEILTCFRSNLKDEMPMELLSGIAESPEKVVSWVDANISLNLTDNYYGTPIVPSGVWKLKTSDPHSRDIFFVALCRTSGMPARIEPATGRPQYYDSGHWKDVWFHDSIKPGEEKSQVTFVSEDTNPVPEYHIHFTLSGLENGRYKTLDYGYNVKISDLPGAIDVFPGRYMLLTGNRDNSGNVLAAMSFFEIKPDSHDTLDIRLRKEAETVNSELKINLNRTFRQMDGADLSLPDISGEGVVIVWIEPDKEPSKHVLRDLAQYKKDLDDKHVSFLFLLEPANATEAFRPSEIEGLPENVHYAWDPGYSFFTSVNTCGSGNRLPVVMVLSSDGLIRYTSQGYIIGIGEQILKNIK